MRLKIFILTTMLITIISGVLFYKNLTQLSIGQSIGKLDFDELRSIDHEITKEALYLRKNFYSNNEDLHGVMKKINEFKVILSGINKTGPSLAEAISKLDDHFKKRLNQLNLFDDNIKKLDGSIAKLHTSLLAIEKNKIKFTLDKNEKKDFYRDALLDAYLYISISTRENEMRLFEDVKILSQIISYSNTPILEVKAFYENLEIILKQVKSAEVILNDFKEDSIEEEMKIIAKYYDESTKTQNEQNENILTFVFAALGIYIAFLIFILRKRS